MCWSSCLGIFRDGFNCFSKFTRFTQNVLVLSFLMYLNSKDLLHVLYITSEVLSVLVKCNTFCSIEYMSVLSNLSMSYYLHAPDKSFFYYETDT